MQVAMHCVDHFLVGNRRRELLLMQSERDGPTSAEGIGGDGSVVPVDSSRDLQGNIHERRVSIDP